MGVHAAGTTPAGRATSPPSSTGPLLTSDQILLVRTSWPVIAERVDVLTVSFYEHLFEIDETAARLFTGVDMAGQRAKLAQTLGVVVKALDDVDRLLPAVAAVGKRHTHYGVQNRHFDSMGEALLLAFSDTLGADFTPEVRAAWTKAYALLASVMKRALIRSTGTVA